MTIDGNLLSPLWIWVFSLLYGAALLAALNMAPWGRFRNPEQLHVYLGMVVALLLLWAMEIKVQPGLSFHLLGATAATLMFGWSLAVIAVSLALLGTCVNGGGWEGFALNAILAGVIPVTLTQILLILVRAVGAGVKVAQHSRPKSGPLGRPWGRSGRGARDRQRRSLGATGGGR
jgi:uncharacterized membrane protein